MYCSRCGIWTPDSASACARCGEPLAPAVPVVPGIEAVATPLAPEAAPAVRYAGFWRRFAAAFVDFLLLYFPGEIFRISSGLPATFSWDAARSDADMSRLLLVTCVTGVAGWLYCALLESSRWRGTLGQQLLGMRVGDRSGNRISFGRATGRYFAQYLSAMLCGLGYLFNLWTARRQTLHDMVAGCVLTVPPPEAVTAGERVAGPAS